MSKSKALESDVEFILSILVGGTAYTHRRGLDKTIHYSVIVKASAVRQVVTGLKIYKCDRAMVITNSYFSKVAIRLAKSNECKLLDRDKLLVLNY